MEICRSWHNIILFSCQTLVGLCYLILTMLKDKHAKFMMCSLFLTVRGFILENAVSKNDKFIPLTVRYSFTVSEGDLLKFIYYPHDSDHLSLTPNSLAHSHKK